MSKTYFTTIGPNGEVHTRGSREDYGYTVAGWYSGMNGKWNVSFSRDEYTLRRTIKNPTLFVSPVTKSDKKPKAGR